MPASAEDLVTYLSLLSEELNLRVYVPQNVKGGLITGTSATVGGMCGGPVGVLLGGVFGGTVAAVTCKPEVNHLRDILVGLNRSKRMEVFKYFEDSLSNTLNRARNFTELNSMIERNPDLKHTIINRLKQFVTCECGLKIYDPRLKEEEYVG